MPPNAAAPTIPIALITGFLGSGKTTLLNALLRHPAMRDTAVIVNEFGEIGLDHLLIETAFEDALLLKSGCICCTVRGDLTDTILTLRDRRRRGEIPPFARIAIETTGLADPAPIIATLAEEPRLAEFVALGAVLVTVDAVHGASQLRSSYEAVKQAALADALILTKTDLAGAATRAELEADLRSINPAAAIHAAVKGAIDPALLFESAGAAAARDRLTAAARVTSDAAHDRHSGDRDHLLRHHGIHSFALTHDTPVPWPVLQEWLEALASLKGPDLLRLKGLVDVAGRRGPVLLNAVQHVFHPPQELARWPDADHRTRLVFITRNIPEAAIADSFAAIVGAAPAEADPEMPAGLPGLSP